MVKRGVVLLAIAGLVIPVCAQKAAPQTAETGPTLRVTSRAVLVDVLVTGKDGQPVRDLKQDAFTVTEQGKPQTIAFFEEHHGAPITPVSMPTMPPNVFTNFSPYRMPPAVNIVLLDSLNTRMASQSWVHDQALKFLGNTRPGTQTAIFAMGLGLHFIQGFTGDPVALVAALKNKKNNNVEQSVLLMGQDETNTEANLLGMMGGSVPGGGPGTAAPGEAIAALSNFFAENNTSRGFDRYFRTLQNLQRLAAFLNSFPGRKNLIWFSEGVPAGFLVSPGVAEGQENPSVDAAVAETMDMLSAARVAIYPVDARGLSANSLYEAQTVLPTVTTAAQMSATLSNTLTADDQLRNGDQANMDLLAEQTGGRAFYNTNGLGQVMQTIQEGTSDFYTVSYTPTDPKMDKTYRKIDVKVAGGKYKLAYRRGYYAVDSALPGTAVETRNQAIQSLQQQKGGMVDPLLPFMDLSMPQSDQILYEEKILPLPPNPAATGKDELRYGVDFAVALKDLKLTLDPDGTHRGVLNVTLIVYDRYGKIMNHWEHLAALAIKPDVYSVFQTRGVQLHADIATPKGTYWLRTGIFDENSRKVGTLEIPLSAVKPVESAAAERP